ncbi:hypothetical protein HYFRA_00012467 [Hymenoscyphus fraxineus]|uniref:Uncharacterized protein n=1 Tax=Hymenoscyphus fraxineus TaxID=746836 RepID=A0A9N9L2D6_9HELO|nr:hypothetical protein HYFRA_00012467 [Hymenoscyphus fraxineus]
MSTTRPNESVLSIIFDCIFACFIREIKIKVQASTPPKSGQSPKKRAIELLGSIEYWTEQANAASKAENTESARRKARIEIEPALEKDIAELTMLNDLQLKAGGKLRNMIYEKLALGQQELQDFDMQKYKGKFVKERGIYKNRNKEGVGRY